MLVRASGVHEMCICETVSRYIRCISIALCFPVLEEVVQMVLRVFRSQAHRAGEGHFRWLSGLVRTWVWGQFVKTQFHQHAEEWDLARWHGARYWSEQHA